MKTYLKMKIGGLAAEAKIIKREEQKWKLLGKPVVVTVGKKGSPSSRSHVQSFSMKRFPGTDHPLRLSLHEHRIAKVRPEIRAALLAYGFLRGRTYLQIENNTKSRPPWTLVIKNIKQFGVFMTSDQLIEKGYTDLSEQESALKQRFAEWIDNSGLPASLKPYAGVSSASK